MLASGALALRLYVPELQDLLGLPDLRFCFQHSIIPLVYIRGLISVLPLKSAAVQNALLV
jgi:hypothetical protein